MTAEKTTATVTRDENVAMGAREREGSSNLESTTVQDQSASETYPISSSPPSSSPPKHRSTPSPVRSTPPSATAATTAQMPEDNTTSTDTVAEASDTPSKPATTATPVAVASPKKSDAKHASGNTTTLASKPATQNASASAAPTSVTKTTQPASKAGHKKKRKRKGLAGLLLALGCLSADGFEEDKSKSGAAKTGTSAPAANKPTGAAATKKDAKVPSSDATSPGIVGHQADATGTTLVGDSNHEADKAAEEQVIVPPKEPQTLPVDETAGVTSSAVQPPGGGSALLNTPSKQAAQRESEINGTGTSAERTETSGGYTDISNSDVVDESTGKDGDEMGGEDYLDYDDEEDRLIEQGGMGIPLDEHGNPVPLLPPLAAKHKGRKCLVLDLDETLLHSSFKGENQQLPTADYIVPVEIESQVHNVYVVKRPGVDQFLAEMAKYYEVVVFTASLSKYADPVLDMLDTNRVVAHRLFRESCYNHKGNYVKDLSQLGRDIHTSIIIDNSPASYIFHPNNAVPISTWFSDPHDSELTDLCPFLADLSVVDDVRGVLDGRI